MKMYKLKDGVLIKAFETAGKQIALSAWKSPSTANEINYSIYFVYKINETDEFPQNDIISTINVNRFNKNKWNKESLKWVTLKNNVFKFSLNQLSTLSRRSKRSVDQEKNWEYVVLFRNPEEDDIGVREDENLTIDSDFCTKYISTTGANKVLGGNCPIDPSTNKQMKHCLNWRRNDDVGKECTLILNQDEKERSIDNFCKNLPDAEDCRCVNRVFDKTYQSKKSKYPSHDYCWYEPCSSGWYLVKNQDKKVNCDSSYCQVIYQNENIGGNVTLGENSNVQNCFESSKNSKPVFTYESNTATDNNDDKFIIIGGVVLIVFLILFSV